MTSGCLPQQHNEFHYTIQNGLATMHCLSNFLEQVSQQNSSVGSIVFAIYVKCTKPKAQFNDISNKTFCFKGSELHDGNENENVGEINLLESTADNEDQEMPLPSFDNTQNEHGRPHTTSPTFVPALEPIECSEMHDLNPNNGETDACRRNNAIVREISPNSTTPRTPFSNLVPRITAMPRVIQSSRIPASLIGTLNLGGVRKQKTVQYTFPISCDSAASCLSLLLDASSVTLHSSSTKPTTIASVNARMSEKIVTAIFQKQKNMMKKNGGNVNGMKYVTLLPTQLQKKNVILEFPCLELVRRKEEHFKLLRSQRISTNVSKASKNSKETNISLLSFMLMNESEHTDIRNDIMSFAFEGFGRCRRVSDCKDECTNKSLFMNIIYETEPQSIDNRIGFGTVDPFATYLFGNRIPSGEFLVKFEKVVNTLFLESTRYRNFGVDHVMKYPVTWSRSAISRVIVKNEFSEPLGTAIMVRQILIHGPISANKNMDIGYACELCDFMFLQSPGQVALSSSETDMSHSDILNMRYPFAEWYSLRIISHLQKKQFETIPITMSHLLKSRAFIWHRNQVSEISQLPRSD
ncbi:hypothetical protein FGB62_242g010 [Gracilaria domingensis]|nr:hypothetical protein FGB62_242g010 [Gracilaria domingensis]